MTKLSLLTERKMSCRFKDALFSVHLMLLRVELIIDLGLGLDLRSHFKLTSCEQQGRLVYVLGNEDPGGLWDTD